MAGREAPSLLKGRRNLEGKARMEDRGSRAMAATVPTRRNGRGPLPALPLGLALPYTVAEVLVGMDRGLREGKMAAYRPIPTGFPLLDQALGGGLRAGELALIGGPQGIGKTILAWQMARSIAASGAALACYLCYEHGEDYLAQRLLCLESAERVEEGLLLADLRRMALEGGSLEAMAQRSKALAGSLERISRYWGRLLVARGHPLRTTLRVIDLYLQHLGGEGADLALFVDYLQKVPLNWEREEATEEERVSAVVEGLKNLALAYQVAVVAIAAAEVEGLKAPRLRLAHLRGGSALMYECDVAIILNPKARLYPGEPDNHTVVFSIEKNRAGPTGIELEFDLEGERFRFDPQGRRRC